MITRGLNKWWYAIIMYMKQWGLSRFHKNPGNQAIHEVAKLQWCPRSHGIEISVMRHNRPTKDPCSRGIEVWSPQQNCGTESYLEDEKIAETSPIEMKEWLQRHWLQAMQRRSALIWNTNSLERPVDTSSQAIGETCWHECTNSRWWWLTDQKYT